MTARTSDPATSHLAATYIAGKRPGLKDAFLMALKVLGPSTANEIAQWCVQSGVSANAESVRKRAKELIDDGLAKYGPQKECSVTKQQAGTLELTNANPSVVTEQKECTATERRTSTSNPGRNRQTDRDSQAVQSIDGTSQQNQEPAKVSTLEAERVKAVAEYVRHEREWIDNWRVGQEMSMAAKTLGTWPVGTADEYIRACDSASAQGLIEQEANRVRAKRQAKETTAKQMGLFE